MRRSHKLARFALAATAATAVWAGAGLAGAESAVVGTVAELEGRPVLMRDGQLARPLACGDRIREGDRLVTGPDGALAVNARGLHVQVATSTSVQVDHDRSGGVELSLESGALRLLDARDPLAPAATFLVDGVTRVVRAVDAEAILGAEGATFCAWQDGGGSCVRVDESGGQALDLAESPRVPVVAGGTCGWQQAILGLPSELDFAAPVAVAVAPEPAPAYEIEPDLGDPVCADAGPECGGEFDPELPPPGLPELDVDIAVPMLPPPLLP